MCYKAQRCVGDEQWQSFELSRMRGSSTFLWSSLLYVHSAGVLEERGILQLLLFADVVVVALSLVVHFTQ
jgi:hypothetical protein